MSLALKQKLAGVNSRDSRDLLATADSLVRKSVWILGGDGWAYDIGFGGLDHVLGSGANVNVLVLDTEVYSNTGGQMSKSTPRAAVAKFAAGGKLTGKKDLAMEAISYGSVYVARVAMGGNDMQTVKAFLEAEAYHGPSLIIAYSHCIAHGYDMVFGLNQQKSAVLSGYWPLIRYNPALRKEGKNPFQLDSKAPTIPLKKFAYEEARYTILARSKPEAAAKLLRLAQDDVDRQWYVYQNRAAMAGAGSGRRKACPAGRCSEDTRERGGRSHDRAFQSEAKKLRCEVDHSPSSSFAGVFAASSGGAGSSATVRARPAMAARFWYTYHWRSTSSCACLMSFAAASGLLRARMV